MSEFDKLVSAVRAMRRLQRLYFAERDHETLLECKDAERRVDELLKSAGKPDLFAGDR